MVTRATQEGLNQTKGVMWQGADCPLGCPCFTMNAVNVSSESRKTKRTDFTPCTKTDNTIGLQGTHDSNLWREVIRFFEAQELEPSKLTTKYYFCLCNYHSQSNGKETTTSVAPPMTKPTAHSSMKTRGLEEHIFSQTIIRIKSFMQKRLK